MKSKVWGARLLLAGLVGLGCGDRSPQTSSSSHWFTCSTNAECTSVPLAVQCSGGYCVDAKGDRIAKAAGGSSGTSSGGAGMVSGGAGTVSGGGTGGRIQAGGATSGGSSQGGGAPTSGGAFGNAGANSSGGAGAAGEAGAGSGGATDCGCVRGAYIPVCGVDGMTHDATCGDVCVPVAIACRGQCPCPPTDPGMCSSGTATSYPRPNLDKTCTSAADCFVDAHLKDCCGSEEALAFNNRERERFTAYEAACPMLACGCPTSQPMAEDGSLLTMISDARAECIDGRCIARSPATQGTCLATSECMDDTQGTCREALGPVGNGVCRGSAGVCFSCR
ncbi:MAG: hypothetical protein ACOY0T_16890 [Myxococcota bacterium]